MENNNKEKKSYVVPIILGVAIVGLAILGFKKIAYAMKNEDTDNSQLECNISPVVPKIGGYVETLNVKENQFVKKGDTLLTIDARDLQIRVKQAEINLATAIANVNVAKSNSATTAATAKGYQYSTELAKSNLETAKVRVWQAQQDFDRIKRLYDLQSATQQQLDNARAALETAEKQQQAASNQIAIAREQAGASTANIETSVKNIDLASITIDQRRQELEMAKLQLSYATITAATSGYISKKNVQLGQLVNAGQSLFSIVDENEMWVMANFKETQIENMKVGQKVKIEVDAYPDKEFEGQIESIAAATGSKFALLPPDNATGNFVKVVQRIPVKIILDKNQDKVHPLRAGFNVKVIVKVK